MPQENPKPKPRNPKSLANLKPPFDGSKPGPGRPRLTEDERIERQILKDASPEAASRLRAAIHSKDEKNAIRASEIILSKTVPDLTEGVIHDDRPLRNASDEQLAKKLAELDAGAQGHTAGNGAAA